ncbi:HAD family phosphatase [Labilibacter sediminis]|nr:HAD family phosphatase [Labilibacter sediminis]
MEKIDFKNVKNIIFDWGGVITGIDFDAPRKAFVKYGIDNFEKFYCKTFQSELFQQHEIGKISADEFRAEFRKQIPVTISDDEIDEAWFTVLLETSAENLDLLKSLRNKYRIFLLSNTNDIHIDMYDQIFESKHNLKNGLRSLFEKVYYSYEIGLRKPSEEIFKYLLQDSRLNPDETLFIDDSIQNIKPAKELGIKCIHFTSSYSLTDILGPIINL